MAAINEGVLVQLTRLAKHGAVQTDIAIINYSYIIIYTFDSPAMSQNICCEKLYWVTLESKSKISHYISIFTSFFWCVTLSIEEMSPHDLLSHVASCKQFKVYCSLFHIVSFWSSLEAWGDKLLYCTVIVNKRLSSIFILQTFRFVLRPFGFSRAHILMIASSSPLFTSLSLSLLYIVFSEKSTSCHASCSL